MHGKAILEYDRAHSTLLMMAASSTVHLPNMKRLPASQRRRTGTALMQNVAAEAAFVSDIRSVAVDIARRAFGFVWARPGYRPALS